MITPRILFEDEFLAVIDKPAGMVVNRSQTQEENTVQDWFATMLNAKYCSSSLQGVAIHNGGEFWQKGGVVHRLDKDTSGVMVLAKTPEAYEGLKQQFLERKTIKKYAALVHGGFRDPDGVISQPIIRHPKDRHRFTTQKGGDLSRTAITEWKVIKQCSMLQQLTPGSGNAQYSLLELTPRTGRTHQLRVHLQYMHHPIVGDPIYGFKKTWAEDLEWCPRLFLHAKYLEFEHPATGEKAVFEADLPQELTEALDRVK